MEKMENFNEVDGFAGKNKNWCKNENFKQINVHTRNVKIVKERRLKFILGPDKFLCFLNF